MTATVTEINSSTVTEAEPTLTTDSLLPEPTPAPVNEVVKITITGFRASGNVEQVLELGRPQGSKSDESISYVWQRVRGIGGIVLSDNADSATFYALETFEKVTIEVSPAVGVSLQ